MSQVTGTNFALGSYEKFQPCFRDEKKAKNPGDEFWCETRETEQTWQNTKIITFAPIIALATLLSCITAVKWDAYDVENTEGNARRRHLGRQKVFCKSFSPLTEIAVGKTEISGTRASPPSRMNTSKILQRV